MRLNRIKLFSYRPLAGRYFLLRYRCRFSESFLWFRLIRPLNRSLPVFFLPYLVSMYFGITEPLKTPVIAAFLLFIDLCCSVPWLKTAHDINIVDMRFFYRQLPPAFFCAGTISDMDLFIRKQRFHLIVQFPPHGSHICCFYKPRLKSISVGVIDFQIESYKTF